MEDLSMSISNGGPFYPEQLAEEPEKASPTRRVAAYYHSDSELVGRSQAFLEVMKQVERVANTDLPVLLTGESVTVKELLACAIHQRSDRRDQHFVVADCGATPALESELFAEADGGTLFLDDITETTSSFQIELLRALQTGEIRRAGSNEVQKVNARVIAGGYRNLEQEVAAGRFCSDLFQRLSAVSITLPQCVSDYGAQPESTNSDWVTLSVVEGRYVARVLEHTGGNKQAAARVLAIDRKTLDRMIKRHHIDCHRVSRARAKASGSN